MILTTTFLLRILLIVGIVVLILLYKIVRVCKRCKITQTLVKAHEIALKDMKQTLEDNKNLK